MPPQMQIVRGKIDIAIEGFLLLQIMQAHQTSYRLPIRVLVQEKAQIWCKLGAKSGFLGARLVQKGQGICPDLESSGRVDWIRTSDPLTPQGAILDECQ